MDSPLKRWISSIMSGMVMIVMPFSVPNLPLGGVFPDILPFYQSTPSTSVIRQIPADNSDANKWKLYLYERTLEEGYSYSTFLLLRRIIHCESTWRQYDDFGNTLRGVWSPDDLGLFQINMLVHKETSLLIHGDVNDPYINIDYGLYLFKRDGTKPWQPSKSCFSSYE